MAKRKPSKRHPIDDDPLPENDDLIDTLTTLAPRTRRTETNIILYMDRSLDDTEPVIHVLAPPDMSQCQCEWPNTTLATFGPKPIARCMEEPTMIAFQKRPEGSNEPTGAMSLCDDHKVMLEHMYPGHLYFRRITTDKKIGDFV
jgi:hypothetical protein